MAPPAVIACIIGPVFLIFFIKLKEGIIRAVRRYIGPRLIAFGMFINPLAIQPLVKRTAVVKYAVQDNFHPAAVNLLHQTGKKGIGSLKVFLIRYPGNVLGRMFIFLPKCRLILQGQICFRKHLSSVMEDHAVMRVNVLIVLAVILMVRGRYKHRV